MHDQDIARHLRALSNPDPQTRDRATRVLVALGAPAVPALIETLNAEGFLARIRAAKILGEIGDARAARPLIEALRLLGHADPDTGRAFAGGLARLVEQNPVPEMRAALSLLDSDFLPFNESAERIRTALARLAQPEVAPPSPDEQARRLAGQLRQTLPFGRGETVRALVALGAPAVSPLVEALRWSPSEDVRERAAEALCAIGDVRAVAPLLAALKDEMEETTRGKMARRLQSMVLPKDAGADPNLTRPLLAALTAEAGDVRHLAFHLLVAAGPPAAPALFAVLDSRSHAQTKTRREAVLILGHIGIAESAPALRAACTDPSPLVSQPAVAALGRLNAARLSDTALLIQALRDESAWVRSHAAAALGALAEDAASLELRRALSPLRRLAARSLLGPNEVRDACQKAMRQIEAATGALKSVPLPAAAPPPDPATLPLPAASPAPEAGALPVPAAAPAPGDAAPAAGWWPRVKQALSGRRR